MEIHKGHTELLGFDREIDDIVIFPEEIKVNDTDCEVSFRVYNKLGFNRIIVRKGKHKDFVFTTSVFKKPFTINLKTNVIKNIRNGQGSNIRVLNKSMNLIDNEIIQVTKDFAQKNLSKECLKYADAETENYYEWSLEDTGWIVVYELPMCFDVDLYDISNKMYLYCTDYIEDREIAVDDFSHVYTKNMKKKIEF